MLKKILSLLLLGSLVVACQGTPKEEEYQPMDESQMMTEVEEACVSDRVFFDFDKSNLTREAKEVLDSQVEWLKGNSRLKVTIEGHCDERGTVEYNLALGARRAEAVKKYLVKHGINASRIRTISYGKERPAMLGSGESVWRFNRRAVTVVD